MTRLARIWRRLFGTRDVQVFDITAEPECLHEDPDVVWCWHARGVLHVVSLWERGIHETGCVLVRYSFPLVNVGYWTKGRP